MDLFWLFPLLCLIFMVGMMFFMLRGGSCMPMCGGARTGRGAERETPRQVLDSRLANGEIGMDRSTFAMKKITSRAPALMLVFAAIGIVDAAYVAYAVYTGQFLWCPPPIDGCNTVASSPYARVFGVPAAYLGVVFYSVVFTLAALLRLDPHKRGLRLGVLGCAALGVSGSIYFMVLQAAYIHAFCIYCLISAVLTLLLFITALLHSRAMRGPAVMGPRPRGGMP
ncbi:MAG: vitamin K epoxide reductase family protein [Burkholderiaceae bacterium]